MKLPSWLVPILVDVGVALVKKGVEAVKDKVDETPTKVDDKLVDVVDIVLEHKVKQKNTTASQLLRDTVKEEITRLKL